jgi:hypothetical protein
LAAYIALVGAFLIGFVLHVLGWQWWRAWALSCLVMPFFIMGTVVLQLDGWEWWPVAIFFGSIYGAASGAVGVLAAVALRRARAT